MAVAYSTTSLTAQQQADFMNQIVAKDAFCVLTAEYTLTSQTAIQKIFSGTGVPTAGALVLPTGVYEFEALLNVASMDATSGNGTFDILGAGTATLIAISQQAIGVDATTLATNAAAGAALSITSAVALAVAATGTAVGAIIRGTFTVSVAGTIIPSIGQTTAAAAVVKIGTMIRVKRLGDYGNAMVGAWV